ncbi:MAG: hypothetical protein WC009_07305 [Methylotenera sp.]
MNTSDIVAIFALIISFGSFYIGKRSLDFAIEMQKTTERKLIENEKAELLRQVSNNKSILNNVRIEIGALQANFGIETQPVKELMKNYTNIFTEFLPSIERALSLLESDYANLINWRGEMSYSDIMRTKASSYEALKQYETSHEQAIQCIAIFKEKLKQAKDYVNGAAR